MRELANIIARLLLSLKGQGNCERVLRNRRKQTSLLFWRRTSRRTQETIGHLALPWSLERWWGKQSWNANPNTLRTRKWWGAVSVDLQMENHAWQPCLTNMLAFYYKMTRLAVEGRAVDVYLNLSKTFITVSRNTGIDKWVKCGLGKLTMMGIEKRPKTLPSSKGCDQWHKVQLETKH